MRLTNTLSNHEKVNSSLDDTGSHCAPCNHRHEFVNIAVESAGGWALLKHAWQLLVLVVIPQSS